MVLLRISEHRIMLRLVGSDTEMKVINLDERVGKETLKLRFCSLRLVSIPSLTLC